MSTKTQDDIVWAAGLSPAFVTITAYAPPLPDQARPALIAGTTIAHQSKTAHYVIRAWPVIRDPSTSAVERWDALAFVSTHPGLALNELTEEERERLRAESMTPAGLDKPVGQEQVIDKLTPLREQIEPPITESEAYGEPEQDDDGVLVTAAACGGLNCLHFEGPEGSQDAHDENTCPESAAADRG